MYQAPAISPQGSCVSGCRMSAVRNGYFFRKSDRVLVKRFRCSDCGKSFSEATNSECYRQKKRHLNEIIFRLLCGGYSQRRAAFDLEINRKTIVRKFCFLGQKAILALTQFNMGQPRVTHMQFDDLETSVHTKCKPVSVPLAVDHPSRRILGFRVANMPAKGRLAKIALKKYGPRTDERPQARQSLFEELKPLLATNAIISSDENPHYAPDVRKYFPGHVHKTTKGRRGCVVGQGELKRGGFDPLFSLNHTCAMLRANVNRLVRRTWCTSKKKDRLRYHIAIYAHYHNLLLINCRPRTV